jgi:tetratricopeptide (TPR) repeat protein
MPPRIDYDFFVSYASADNRTGWVDQFVTTLVAEHQQLTGRTLTYFLDRNDIQNFAHWHSEIFNKGLTRALFFLCFLSPNYLASEICRREWKAWIDQEIALHILASGSAPIYCVEVPGFVSKPMLPELEVARQVATLCALPMPHERFTADLAPIVKELRRRQISNWVQPYRDAGVLALQKADLRQKLQRLAQDIDTRSDEARRADASVNTVPAYNKNFSGRLDELIELRKLLTDNRTGVIAGVHGLGGIGKTELAFTFAHAYASVYPGGRFYVGCEYQSSLLDAVNIALGEANTFRSCISDEERKQPQTHFAAILRCLKERLETLGPVLLVLDNVTDLQVVGHEQTDALTVLGPQLHLLATTRLATGAQGNWLTLGEMKADDALALLEKYRPFADDTERAAAETIVRKLGGFALAIELVAAGLAVKTSATYASIAAELCLDDLDMLAEDTDVELRRHNHEKRLQAVLGPTLAGLKPEERRTLEYAAFLPPDRVALPWLRELVVADFPALTTAGRWGDPWQELCVRLERLGLFTPVEETNLACRQVRLHRLVRELLRRELSADESAQRQDNLDALVKARDAELGKTTQWQEAVWELEPFDALARLWDETGHPRAAWLLNQVGYCWHHLAEYARAEPLMCRALVIDEHAFGPDHSKVAIRLNNLATLLKDTNRLAEAEPLMRRALAIEERSFGLDHPHVAIALSNLATLVEAANRLSEAETLMRRALAIHECSLGPDHPNVATGLNNLATLLKDTNRLAEAEPLMRRALAIVEHSFGSDHPKVAAHLNNLALLLKDTNRLAEAEPLMRRVAEIFAKSLGPNHPHVAIALSSLGLLLGATNRLAEAEPLLRRALAILEHSFGPDHPNVATGLSNLAMLLRATNRLAEAEPLLRRALAIDERAFDSDHPKVAAHLNNLALLLKDTNRLAEAEPLMRRVAEIFAKSLGPNHPHVAIALSSLALLLKDTNRLAEAEPLLRRALAIHECSLGPDHPNVATALNNLALLLKATNRLAEAEPLMRRHLIIELRFQLHTGHPHPHLDTGIHNYVTLLSAMGLLPEDIQQRFQDVLAEVRQSEA